MARRHSAAVYRRRRLAVFLAALVVAAAVAVTVWLVIAQPWARADTGDPAAPASSTPPAKAPPEKMTEKPTEPSDADAPVEDAEGAEQDSAPVACQPGDLDVVAVTDAETYPAGALPQLAISLTNRSDSDCTLDVGSSTQVFTVTSGTDVWWRSTDCQQNPSSMVVTLTAGQTVRSAAPVEWDRTRSGVDTCDLPNRPRAPGGGSSYHVSVSIGGVEAAHSAQILLYGD